MRLGYACINMSINASTNRRCIKRTFKEKGIEYVSYLALENCKNIIPILRWNYENDVFVWRLSSELFPWMSEYEFDDLPDIDEIRQVLAEVGRLSKELGIRLSFHPGPFNVLASPKEHVVEKTIKELNQHSEIFNMMGFEPSHENKINIHIRATYGGDFSGTGERFIKNFHRLETHTKRRLTLENDDKASQWSVVHLMDIYEKTGIPIVFDFHHHRFCTGGLSEKEALETAMKTWPKGIIPVTHYSESAPNKMPQAHSEYIEGPIPDYGLEFDCVIEAKAKNLCLLEYRSRYNA